MPKGDGKTLESLYLELGLDLSRLQADILAADRTVTENLGRLNREKNTIKLRVEADIAALDRVKDAASILEIQERGLNQQLALSRDKLAILEAAYKQVAANSNSTSLAVQSAEKAFLKEKIAVGQLEAQLKSLSAQKVSIDTTQLQEKISQLNSKIQHVKIQADIDVSKLKDAGSIFDAQKVHIAAVTKELELQRQKLIQLREAMYQSAKNTGGENVQTLNIKSNVLQQIQEISRLETRLKELRGMNINLQIRADSIKQAEQTINENISRINARIENIRVKTDIDVSRLGAAASEFDKAKAHVQGLNRELDLQNQKLSELKKALGSSVSANGLNNVKTINLQTEIQKQIQAIDQLKAKINELNKIEPPKTNSLLSGYLNIKGDVAGKLNSMTLAFSNLKGATSSADNAITSVLGVIGEIPHPAARAAATLAGLPIIFKGIENSIIDMTRAAAASGDAVYVMSRGMQMSVKDAGKFSTNAKVAGTDVNSLATAIKNVQRQIVRGGDDSRGEEWLRRYGESARNANGDLKNLNEMTFSLSRALHKAQEEGKGAEFIFSVFRNVSADDITAIEDWIAVNEQAATIVKNGLANPALAHEVKGNLNALAVQEGQLKASFESALLPVANEIIPRVTDRMGRLTQVIADNKDVIKELGKDLATVWGGVETVVDGIVGGVGAIGGVLKDVYMAKTKTQNRLVEQYKDDTEVTTAEDLLKKELLRSYLPTERAAIENSPYLYKQELSKYEIINKSIQNARKKIKEEKKVLEKELSSVADMSSAAVSRRAVEEDPKLIRQAESIKKILQETSDIQYKLSHSDYENKKLDVLQWQQDMLNQAEMTEEKRVAIEKLGAAKLEQIEKEHNEKIQEYVRNAADIEYEITHSAFEKQIRDIERWEELQKRKAESTEEAAAIGAEAVAKEARAFEQEMDRIKGTLQSLEDKIFEQEHSQYENDLRRAQQERLKLYEDFQSKGILNVDTQAMIERYFQNAVGKLNRRADESRTKGGDYTKTPEGAMQGGGNGIVLIGADQIIDNGLISSQQREIALLTDENQIRAQLMPKLDEEARAAVARIQAAKNLSVAQKDLIQATQQATSGFQLIEGDKFSNMPVMTQDTAANQMLAFPAEEIAADIQPLQDLKESAQGAADVQKEFAEKVRDFPPDYFKNLADNAKAVSEMQGILTRSTMDLIKAQDNLVQSLKNLPNVNPSREINNNQPPTTDGFLKLSTSTQDLKREQDLLARSTQETNNRLREISDIPSQKQIAQKDSGFKLGFDWDVASGFSGIGLAALKLAQAAGAIAPHPAIKAGAMILGAGLGAGFGVGSYNEMTAPREDYDERLKAMPANVDLSPLETSLSGISENVQSILQSIQDTSAHENDRLQEMFGALPNIEEYVKSVLLEMQSEEDETNLSEYFSVMPKISEDVQSILQSMQSKGEIPDAPALQQLQMPEPNAALVDYLTPLNNIDGKLQSILQATQMKETISFETVITPLNSINTIVGNILTALSNRKPPQITVSPNNSINLGGAYVFDNEMKQQLVNDITSKIVDEIIKSVQQAISKLSYGYSA